MATDLPRRARAIISQNFSDRSRSRSSISSSSIARMAATGFPLRVTMTTSSRAASRVFVKWLRASNTVIVFMTHAFTPSGPALESRTGNPSQKSVLIDRALARGSQATRRARWRYGYRRVRLLRANLASRPPRTLLPVRGQWPDLRSGLDAHAPLAVWRHRPRGEHGPGVLHGGPRAGELLGRPPRRSTRPRPPPLRRARGRDRRQRDRLAGGARGADARLRLVAPAPARLVLALQRRALCPRLLAPVRARRS